MIQLAATKAALTVVSTETITAGAVGVFECEFQLSDDWNGLTINAVFQAGTVSAQVAVGSDSTVTIPWEVLENPCPLLRVGVYGMQGTDIVLPTIWAALGRVMPSASPAETTQPPTPSVYQQLLANIGNLNDLNTADKSSLVAAINELYNTGGGGGTGNVYSPNIATILVMSQAEYDGLETKSPTTLYLITG